MKRIGFLSFGHWSDAPYSQARTAADVLTQSIELAEAVEAVGKITWRQARPRATSLQNADPRINTVAEKSALFRCSPDPIQMPKTQSQEKMTNRSDMKASVNYSLQLVQGIS